MAARRMLPIAIPIMLAIQITMLTYRTMKFKHTRHANILRGSQRTRANQNRSLLLSAS